LDILHLLLIGYLVSFLNWPHHSIIWLVYVVGNWITLAMSWAKWNTSRQISFCFVVFYFCGFCFLFFSFWECSGGGFRFDTSPKDGKGKKERKNCWKAMKFEINLFFVMIRQDSIGRVSCVSLKRANEIIGTTTEEIVMRAQQGPVA
jgi:hypothetical protein